MKKAFFILTALSLPLAAQLRITEVMSASVHRSAGASGDWFEITNTGSTAVNVGGLSFDDESAIAGASGFLPFYSLQAGESLIVLEESSPEPFRSLWNLAPSVRIITAAEISNFPGLSAAGDRVYLFNGSSIVDSFSFGPATEGVTFARFNNGDPVPGGLSADGVFAAYRSDDAEPDLGSPGVSIDLPPPSPPFFSGAFRTAAVAGSDLANLEFQLRSFDPNPGDTMTLSLSEAPAWLGLSNIGNGVGRFTGTPPAGATGPVTFEVVSTDNTGRSGTQEYRIDLLPASSPIILNEYNAVDPDQFLDGGNADDPGAPSDPFFERIEGNGGAWVEFVVTQTLDLRGWTLEIESENRFRRLKFAQHPALAAIPAGTILTLTESKRLTPTSFNRISLLNLSGFSWSNIWMHDANLIDQNASLHPQSAAIGSNDTRFTWFDDNQALIYGPAGESVALRDTNGNGRGDELIGVGNTEVFKLEATPSSTTVPLNINHDDGGTSTFGRPNQWNNNASIQSFAAFVTPGATPPPFGLPESTTAVRGTYQASVSSPGVPVTVLEAPDFLTIDTSGGTIDFSNNRPLSTADIGSYPVTLEADSGTASNNLGYLVFTLEVVDPAPAVILNEYNAVADDRYLNGGSALFDEDGPPVAEDSHFGRVLGNGGNWFELVVVGNDGPGFLDLTGWSIESGAIAPSGNFVGRSTLTLTDHPAWSFVPHGTILTFTERNTVNGGLNTDLNRVNELATAGYAWSNVHLASSDLVSVSNPEEFRINSANSAFVIRDASGGVVFGPSGEGIAPPEGVGNTDVFELENDPTTLIAATEEATDSALGYDDGSSGSTFGSPNLFAPLNSANDRPQNFARFIPESSAFNNFLAANGLAGAAPGQDSDGDGHANLNEYLFGGDPADAGSTPVLQYDETTRTLTMNVRVNDPVYPVVGQQSRDLETWGTSELTVSDEDSALGPEFVLRSVVYEGSADRLFLRFATSTGN